MPKPRRTAAFKFFLGKVLAPGPVCDHHGRPLNVCKLDGISGLSSIDRRENDFLSELELIPLQSDNVRELLHRARERMAGRGARDPGGE
jgi:hypothetical protein